MQRRTLLGALPLLTAPALVLASAPSQTLQAPNVVPIDAGLVTSGMPSLPSLDALAALGFRRVLHLVPLDVPGMLPDEPARVRAQGLRFDHVPIPWDGPTLGHIDAVFAVLDDWQRQPGAQAKGLVHCEVNMRASCCTFLWRVLRRRENPEAAWEAVTRVWTPRGRWRTLVEQALARGGVRFEPW
ncbi:MAG: hypothetical protein J0L58_13920 [Burkholderiales bacterium]|uniref:hypothetical protein n=1 Tax=Inhella sp. TaxID=1921806 RepID=UPI001AD18664|nr:hypothetical protein [Burkholderiales bacterium]